MTAKTDENDSSSHRILKLCRSQSTKEEFDTFQTQIMERHAIAEEKIAQIESHIADFRQKSEANVHGVISDTEAMKASYTSVEQRIKEVKLEATGAKNMTTINSS